jgi:predicted transcriptional regulator
MKQILVACVSCSGTGKTVLSPSLTKLLRIIQTGRACNASEIYQRLNRPGLGRSAVNQGLKRLTQLGFVKSRKSGRELRVYLPR